MPLFDNICFLPNIVWVNIFDANYKIIYENHSISETQENKKLQEIVYKIMVSMSYYADNNFYKSDFDFKNGNSYRIFISKINHLESNYFAALATLT